MEDAASDRAASARSHAPDRPVFGQAVRKGGTKKKLRRKQMYQDIQTDQNLTEASRTLIASNGVFMRRLAIPLALLLATFAMVCVTLAILAISHQNRTATRASTHLATSAFQDLGTELSTLVATQTRAPNRRADSRLGEIATATLVDERHAGTPMQGIDVAIVLDGADRPIAFAANTSNASHRLRSRFADAAAPLADLVRGNPGGRPVPERTYVRLGEAVYLVAADSMGSGPDADVLVLAKQIDEALLNRLGRDYLLHGLRFSEGRRDTDKAYLRLQGVAGAAQGYLEWHPNRPGDLVIRRLILPLSLAFAISIALTWLVLRRAQSGAQAIDQTADQLAVANRRLTESAQREREARHQAEAAASAKSEFLAVVSHELRTPLNAIIGFSEIIRDEVLGKLGDQRYREYAIDIYTSGVHLLSLLNDILDLSKAEAGKLELLEETVDVPDVIERALKMVSPQAQAASLTIETDIQGALPHLWADERKIRQILINLMSNSLKFTPPGGQITVGSALQGDRLRIWVTDNGIGIAPEHVEKALSPFGQVDSALSRQHDGTGLGLPLVKRLVELHGAAFDLVSGLGEGTTISMVFEQDRVVLAGNERGPDDGDRDQRQAG